MQKNWIKLRKSDCKMCNKCRQYMRKTEENHKCKKISGLKMYKGSIYSTCVLTKEETSDEEEDKRPVLRLANTLVDILKINAEERHNVKCDDKRQGLELVNTLEELARPKYKTVILENTSPSEIANNEDNTESNEDNTESDEEKDKSVMPPIIRDTMRPLFLNESNEVCVDVYECKNNAVNEKIKMAFDETLQEIRKTDDKKNKSTKNEETIDTHSNDDKNNNNAIIPTNNVIFRSNRGNIAKIKINGQDAMKVVFSAMELVGLEDNDELLWFKAPASANILGYENTKKAIIDHVDARYIMTYENLVDKLRGNVLLPLTYNEKNTKWINEYGLYQLILRSKMPLAKEFQSWLYEEALPSIRKTGKYDIAKDKSFFDDHNSLEYNNKKVVYIADVGEHNNEKIYKYGRSNNFDKRENDHLTNFNKFVIKHIELTNDEHTLEKELKKALKRLKMLRKYTINGRVQTELFAEDNNNKLENVIELLTKINKDMKLITNNEINVKKDDNRHDIMQNILRLLEKGTITQEIALEMMKIQ